MATILVADDDQLLRAIIRDHLERADHTVLEAGDGMAAMDLALDERPECLLLDVMMPLARGLEVVRRVRQQEAWHPAIIMVSARTRVTDRLNALEAGADAYIEKPFAPADLLATIEQQLHGDQSARLVDVLGPIWASLAFERLAQDAVTRRTHEAVDHEQVEALFTDLVSDALGRMPGAPAAATAPALRLLWEDAIRGLLRDSGDAQVPVVTDASAPDALSAVERLIGNAALSRQRARFGAAAGLDDFWAGVIDETLVPSVPAGPPARTPIRDERWTDLLRGVLDDRPADADVKRWSAVIGRLVPPPDESAPPPEGAATIDPLRHVWLERAAQATTRAGR